VHLVVAHPTGTSAEYAAAKHSVGQQIGTVRTSLQNTRSGWTQQMCPMTASKQSTSSTADDAAAEVGHLSANGSGSVVVVVTVV
jgi:hypothetical protein